MSPTALPSGETSATVPGWTSTAYDFTIQKECTLITYTTVFTDWVPILDISDRFAVWSHPAPDAEGIWGYDLRADTDDDGIPNYCDPDRPYPDPAACRITEMGKAPAISGDLMVYQTFAFRNPWNIGVIDLDVDDNGILDCRQEGYVPSPGCQLTDNGPWENKANMFPDIWDSLVVWEHWDNDTYDETACNIHAYDLSIDGDGTPNWKDPDRTWPDPAQCEITLDDGGHTSPAISNTIVVWVDWRNNVPGGSGLDIFGYDLSEDSDGDGTPNCRDDDRPNPDSAEFRLTTDPNDQRDPAISGQYVVWTDARKASLDIYGYDLSVDSDDDGIPNYRETVSERPCPDPAEFRITTNLADQDSPDISDDRVVWRDNRNNNRDIYGAWLLTAPSPAPRALWVWHQDAVTSEAARAAFFSFAQSRNIARIYLNAEELLQGEPAGLLREFIATAAEKGMAVELLAGAPEWALTPYHDDALDFVGDAISFTVGITDTAKPVGVHLDAEPHALSEWKIDPQAVTPQYLDLLKKVRDVVQAVRDLGGPCLQFAVDIPFWYDDISATFDGVTKPLNQHVQDLADSVTLMAYRDCAVGPDCIIEHVANELAYAESVSKTIVIGVETNCGQDPEKITFCEEGEEVMEQELGLTEAFYRSSPAFDGFAIHYYRSYRDMVWRSAEEKASDWLKGQMVEFNSYDDIPGYSQDECWPDKVTRYKDGKRACYTPMPGIALVSFDFCDYGTPDQKAYLGRYGRSFVYDQAVGAIALTMQGEMVTAAKVLSFTSSYQNQNNPHAPDGSFGFSFQNVGCTGERDSFYDMDYLRSGANAWLGHSAVFHYQLSRNPEFLEMARKIADYLLEEEFQVSDPFTYTYGLLTGGYGWWDPVDWIFYETDIAWASTEHNIDGYFFLRDLGGVTGNVTYTAATDLIKTSLLDKLWDDEMGRFGRGISPEGLDKANALDTASWGAMFLLAVGEEDKARRSLDFVDRNYRSQVDGIQGYKPYTGTVDGINWNKIDLVWSEGSLGVAMAYLRLGDPENVERAQGILSEMLKLQAMDEQGGLFYSFYCGDEVLDFPRAPSVAGTGWFKMVLRAHPAFWGPVNLYLPLVIK